MTGLTRRWKSILAIMLFAAATCGAFTACGGSGGGSGSDSGSIDIEVAPDTISVDGLAFVSLNFQPEEFDDIETQGLTVKLLAPAELDFVRNSASLTIDHGATPIAPIAAEKAPPALVLQAFHDAGVDTTGDFRVTGDYFIYAFPLPGDLLDKNHPNGVVQVTFQVNGIPPVSTLFADLDRGAIGSFDINQADFDPEAQREIKVVPKISGVSDN